MNEEQNTTGSVANIPPPSTTAGSAAEDAKRYFDIQKMYEQYLNQAVRTHQQGPSPIFSQASQPLKKAYQPQVKQRISIPIGTINTNSTLEMTTGQEGDWVEFTIIIPGKQALHFRAHRTDLEAVTNELTLAKLAK